MDAIAVLEEVAATAAAAAEGTSTLAIRATATATTTTTTTTTTTSRSSAEIQSNTRSIISSTPNESLTLTTDYDGILRLDTPPPTFFFERTTTSRRPPRGATGFLRRWMPPCFRGSNDRSTIDEAYRQAPPSYSTVAFLDPSMMPQHFTRSHLAVLLRNDDPTSSFVVRTPPPSYAQAQGVTYSLEQLISNSANNMRMWSASPTSAVCPRCASLVYTVVEVRRDAATHITALALCLMGCWPCCVLPYCIDSCKKSHHYCPFCRTYLGTYTPCTKMGKRKVKQQQQLQEKEQQQFTRPTRSTSRKKRERTDSETSNDNNVDKGPASRMSRETPSRRKKKANYDPEEEARLEKLVFGDPSDIIKNLQGDTEAEQEKEPVPEVKDDASSAEPEEEEDDDKDSVIELKSDDESVITIDSKVSHKAPVWRDEDDEQLTVVDALKEQHRRLPGKRPETKYTELLQNKLAHVMGTPKWARLDRDDEAESDESDHEILKHSSHVVPKKSKALAKGTIEIKVLADINKQTHMEGPFVNVVQFHETSTVAMVAGSSGVLSLFEVDGRENNKLHNIQFEKFPIHSARFLREGNEIVVGSMSHAYCHSYDLITGKTLRIPLPDGITNMKKFEVSPDGKVIAICGRLGEVHLLYSKTKEIIGTLKMNKKCRSLAFTPDSTKLITHGESSEVYVWDVQSRQCVNRAYDDGCLSACAVAISPNGQFIATGSKQGAVNIYESKSILNEQTPQPAKTVLNLVTAITRLEFNPTTEILAMASDRKANAFRMVHLPSFNVFANFPTFNTKMVNPLDIDFSPASGYMSVSNNKGFAYLYRLKHYGNY